MGDRIAVLHAGRIAQVGTPYEMYNEPNDVFVGGFVGTPTMNMLDAEIRGGTARVASPAASISSSTCRDGPLPPAPTVT